MIWGYSLCMGDTLYRWGEIRRRGVDLHAKFCSIGSGDECETRKTTIQAVLTSSLLNFLAVLALHLLLHAVIALSRPSTGDNRWRASTARKLVDHLRHPRSFRYASPYLWNQLRDRISLRQLVPVSPFMTHLFLCPSIDSPLSASLAPPSLSHSLKTYLYHESLPP